MSDSQKKNQIKFEFGSKEGIITILKPSSLRPLAQNSGRPNLGAFRILAKVKKMFKQSEEITPLLKLAIFSTPRPLAREPSTLSTL
jgi:hypothetical protein